MGISLSLAWYVGSKDGDKMVALSGQAVNLQSQPAELQCEKEGYSECDDNLPDGSFPVCQENAKA